MHFRIDQWRAWAPGLASTADWCAWSAAPAAIVDDQQQPDVSFLPAMQRRRLGRLARMVFQVAWPLAEGEPQLPLVFCSRHGETPRTLDLLTELGRGEPLSPTQFSLSVHNASIGLWSILRGDTSEMTAMGAAGDGLEQAVLEGALLLAEGAPAVLVVIAEELPPALYQPSIDDVPFSHAVALRLRPGTSCQLTRAPAAADPTTAPWPPAIELVRALCNNTPRLERQWKNRRWHWTLAA